ncbi:MAG: hypothetical protein JSR82_07170 [Verrucomicrobia bacterium]|nr:hypothetical protein [Verrucomicrobiota bacterium]
MPKPEPPSAAWRIVLHPLTWGSYLPALGAAFLTAPWWLPAGLGALATVGLGAWWGRRWPLLRDRARFAAIQRWVAEEDADLEARLTEAAAGLDRPILSALGAGSAAQGIRLLQSLLADKRGLESTFLADGALTAEEEEVMELIEGLAKSVRDELGRLGDAARDRTLDEASVTTIRRAAAALHETAQSLQALAAVMVPPEPVTLPAPPPDPRTALRRYTESLEDRATQAQAVRRRLEEAWRSPTATLDGPALGPLAQ